MFQRSSRFSFQTAFCIAVMLVAAPALADSPFDSDIKHALEADNLIIENYTLDKDDLNTFYTARDYRPAWNFSGSENQAAFNGFIDSIGKTIHYHGLEESDFALELMKKLAAAGDPESHMQLELLVADTLLHLAHVLHVDDIDLNTLYPGWNFHRADADIADELAKAVAANAVNDLLEQLTPKNPAYAQLAHALESYRDIETKGGWQVIDPGPVLRPKDRGKRVAQLRARLEAENYLAPLSDDAKGKAQSKFFDNELRKALQDYQSHNGLDADGHVGTGTLDALNVPSATRIEQIRANMERWRHMPEDYPPARAAIVNIPDASIDILDDGQSIYRGPVIVGQVERKTPFIQSNIRSMIINPAWHVPSSIAIADILPKLREDPHYLEKQGISIRDADYDPHGKTIDWKHLSDDEFNYRLRQEPGKKNSLGRLKFDFANDFAVYMHGTPHAELFKKHERDLSSGCVRLRDPQLVAQIVLQGTPGDWDVGHIEEEIATKKTRWIEIKNPLPIDIVYWTAFTDEQGQTQFRNDIYDYDKFLMENLKPATEVSAPAENAGPNP